MNALTNLRYCAKRVIFYMNRNMKESLVFSADLGNVSQETKTNSFVSLTNRFVGKTKNFLGQQKNFISSISTIRLFNTTIFCCVKCNCKVMLIKKQKQTHLLVQQTGL